MNPYNATSYYNDALSGVNQKGDSANGLYGSLTSGAIQNQTTQTPSTPAQSSTTTKPSNPYGEILNYIQPQPKTSAYGGLTQSAPQTQSTSSATTSAAGLPSDEAQRYWRQQWYQQNILVPGLDANNPQNFVGGSIFDQYGNYVTAPVAPTPAPPPAPPPPPQPTFKSAAPNLAWAPLSGGGIGPTGDLPHEAFNPFSDSYSKMLYQQANVEPQAPAMGETKTFPNGNVGRWDGTGWLHIDSAGHAGGW